MTAPRLAWANRTTEPSKARYAHGPGNQVQRDQVERHPAGRKKWVADMLGGLPILRLLSLRFMRHAIDPRDVSDKPVLPNLGII